MDADFKQALSEHIRELRKTLLWSVLTLLILFVALFSLCADEIMDFLLKDINGLTAGVVYTAVAEVWTTKLKVVLMAAFVCAFPFITFYFWRFLAPALYPHEKKIIALTFLAAVLLFVLGVLFAFFVVVPFTLKFFIAFGEGTADAMLTVSKYVSFLLGFTVPFGFVFLLPVAVYLLTKLGLFNAAILVKTRKYVLVLLLIAAAILTPPDVVSQLALFFPMMVLWEVGIVIAKHTKPLRAH